MFFQSRSAQIYETLASLNGPLSHNSLAVIRRANVALDNWYKECSEMHGMGITGHLHLLAKSTDPFRPIRDNYGGRLAPTDHPRW